MDGDCSCIIPFYNEYPQVLYVLRVLSSAKNLSEIICIDDGSSDGSYQAIKEQFPKVILLKHQKNKGKTTAIKTGLEFAKEGKIILIDADLKNLCSKELDLAIDAYKKNQLDCLLLCTKPTGIFDLFLRKTIRLPHCATGCRIIKRSDLLTVLSHYKPRCYQLEFAQNKYLLDHKKKVAYLNINAANTLKIEKVGLIKGLAADYEMWRQALSFCGPASNLRQILFFARDNLSRGNRT